jgi:hypothetical protein
MNDDETYSALSFTVCLKDIKTKEQYLYFLKKKGMHFDSEKDRPDFVKMKGKNLLIRACNEGDQELVELLLGLGADINQTFQYTNSNQRVLNCNPFSASFSSMNIEFVKYLIAKGADPIESSRVLEHQISTEDEDYTYQQMIIEQNKIEPTIGMVVSEGLFKNSSISSEENFVAFAGQYWLLVEKYIEERLSTLLVEEASPDYCVPIKRPPVESSKPTKVVLETPPSPQEKIPKLLSAYIDLKQVRKKLLNEKTINIENEFDILLLKFCRTGSEQELAAVHDYLLQYPELNHYAITGMLETEKSAAVAHSVFMYQPKLLNKFFELKKSFQEDAALIENKGYKVLSNLKHDVYVDIAPKLKCILEENYKDFYKKLKAVIVDCKFIKADSEGMSGIKTYAGIIKLKVAGENWEIMTHTKYLDKSTGNSLIIFDQIIDHKDKPKGVLETIKLDNFTDIWGN